MTYEETLDKIHSFQKFGSKLGLERMTRLMELLGNPQEQIKVIHVAGTNGKGSVCRYLYSVLQENGYKTGLYTSPFLERFTERIESNGSEISEEDLIYYTDRVLCKVETMLQKGMESPTEFELITAIALLYFSEQELDYLILEVGLGGKGDSTNMVSMPIISVITSISFDHMDYLGDTLEKIAAEKAGIIKPGVPVVYNVDDCGAKAVIQTIAEEKKSSIHDVSATKIDIKEKTIDRYVFDAEVEGTLYKKLAISMIGMHQIANAACALTVLEVMKKAGQATLDREKTYSGFLKARQTGRFEVMKKNPFILIDGAHNEAGAESLRGAMQEHFKGRKILMIVGMLADKKIDRLIERFGQITDEFVATEPDSPRKLAAPALCEQIAGIGKNCISIPDPEEACQYARKQKEYDVILFAGSLYLIGKIRGILNHEEK